MVWRIRSRSRWKAVRNGHGSSGRSRTASAARAARGPSGGSRDTMACALIPPGRAGSGRPTGPGSAPAPRGCPAPSRCSRSGGGRPAGSSAPHQRALEAVALGRLSHAGHPVEPPGVVDRDHVEHAHLGAGERGRRRGTCSAGARPPSWRSRATSAMSSPPTDWIWLTGTTSLQGRRPEDQGVREAARAPRPTRSAGVASTSGRGGDRVGGAVLPDAGVLAEELDQRAVREGAAVVGHVDAQALVGAAGEVEVGGRRARRPRSGRRSAGARCASPRRSAPSGRRGPASSYAASSGPMAATQAPSAARAAAMRAVWTRKGEQET